MTASRLAALGLLTSGLSLPTIQTSPQQPKQWQVTTLCCVKETVVCWHRCMLLVCLEIKLEDGSFFDYLNLLCVSLLVYVFLT